MMISLNYGEAVMGGLKFRVIQGYQVGVSKKVQPPGC